MTDSQTLGMALVRAQGLKQKKNSPCAVFSEMFQSTAATKKPRCKRRGAPGPRITVARAEFPSTGATKTSAGAMSQRTKLRKPWQEWRGALGLREPRPQLLFPSIEATKTLAGAACASTGDKKNLEMSTDSEHRVYEDLGMSDASEHHGQETSAAAVPSIRATKTPARSCVSQHRG